MDYAGDGKDDADGVAAIGKGACADVIVGDETNNMWMKGKSIVDIGIMSIGIKIANIQQSHFDGIHVIL